MSKTDSKTDWNGRNRASLTPRQREVLDFIVEYSRAHGCTPTYEELADELGVVSLGTIAEHVNNLIRKGVLERAAYNTARSLRVVTDVCPTCGGPRRAAPAIAAALVAAAAVTSCSPSTTEDTSLWPTLGFAIVGVVVLIWAIWYGRRGGRGGDE